MIVFLMGFMTSGKTSFGKKLARALEYEFIDLDELIETECKASINEIFKNEGEDYFRNLETKILKNIISSSKNKNRVVALGGGTPCYNNNISLLKEENVLVYLSLELKVIIGRLKVDKENRPLVKDLDNDALVLKVSKLFKEREHFYNQANLVLNAQTSVAKLKQEVIHFIENQK